MLTVSNVLLMSSAAVIVPSGSLFWLKPVAMVLFMSCSAVLVEWLQTTDNQHNTHHNTSPSGNKP